MVGPQNEAQDAEAAVTDVVVLALRPLANLLLGQGLGINEFYRVVKWVFVQEAARRQLAEQGRINVSRLAILTGLTRHDVAAQLRTPVKPVAVADYDRQRSHRVLLAWHRDAEFLTPEGQPRPLPREGEHSFHTLIRKHAGDVPRHAMLKELLDSKAIEERADGMLVPKRRSMQQAGTDANNLLEIGRRLHLVSEAIVATLDGPGTPPTCQELRLAEGLDAASALELLATLNRRSERFVELCQALLDEKIARVADGAVVAEDTTPTSAQHRVGLFVSVMHRCTHPAPPPPRKRGRPRKTHDGKGPG